MKKVELTHMVEMVSKNSVFNNYVYSNKLCSFSFSCSNLAELADMLAYTCLPHKLDIYNYGDIQIDEPKSLSMGNLQNYVYSVLMKKTSVRDMLSKFNAIEKALEL